MALSLFRGRSSWGVRDPFDSFLFGPPALISSPSSSISRRAPEHPSFARDVAAVANTQVDWKETVDAHIFTANMPGLARENVKVSVEDGGRVLQISGERKKEETTSSDRWQRVERAEGRFLRSFRLPNNAKAGEVKAAMDQDGVLTVTIPKAAAPDDQPIATILHQPVKITSE